MLLFILSILPIISVFVDGTTSNHEPNHAVSTQSFHRDDVPLSYKYTAVHIYTTPRPEKPYYHQTRPYNHKVHNFHAIQYAPLKQNSNENDNNIHSYKHRTEAAEQYDNIHQQIEEQFDYSTDGNGKDHLEPRLEAENLKSKNQNYRSYVPGHNIDVHQSYRILSPNDLHRAFHNNLHSQKVIIPKYTTHQKTEDNVQVIPENIRAAEEVPHTEDHSILYTFLPRPLVNGQHSAYGTQPHNPHQALPAKLPRLHMNLARVYGIAHLHHQASNVPTIIQRYLGKPPTHTQAIFHPLKPSVQQKPRLYPVQDLKKNYPVRT